MSNIVTSRIIFTDKNDYDTVRNIMKNKDFDLNLIARLDNDLLIKAGSDYNLALKLGDELAKVTDNHKIVKILSKYQHTIDKSLDYNYSESSTPVVGFVNYAIKLNQNLKKYKSTHWSDWVSKNWGSKTNTDQTEWSDFSKGFASVVFVTKGSTPMAALTTLALNLNSPIKIASSYEFMPDLAVFRRIDPNGEVSMIPVSEPDHINKLALSNDVANLDFLNIILNDKP